MAQKNFINKISAFCQLFPIKFKNMKRFLLFTWCLLETVVAGCCGTACFGGVRSAFCFKGLQDGMRSCISVLGLIAKNFSL